MRRLPNGAYELLLLSSFSFSPSFFIYPSTGFDAHLGLFSEQTGYDDMSHASVFLGGEMSV